MLVGCCFAAGCATNQVRATFSSDYDCPTSQVTAAEQGGGIFRAQGCNRSASYRCVEGRCLKLASSGAAEFEATGGPLSTPASRSHRVGEAHRINVDGLTAVALDVRLDGGGLLKLRAAPERHGELVELKLFSKHDLETCEVQWMLDGERVDAPPASDSKPVGGTLYVVQSRISRELVRDLAAAEQFALRACDQRWTLHPRQLLEIRRFVDLYEEELAWMGESRSREAAGMLAPAGGWAEWTVTGSAPAAVSGGAESPQKLFKLLSRSVLKVEAKVRTGIAQGSAVAVGKRELITNCHVLEGARKIVVKHGDREWVASLGRSDPATDRCVLEIEPPDLTPVRGVRAMEDVEVGEKVFTLGSPSGLELTLSDGLLSGLREIDGQQLVQTTAPISPGSSGGGLFDTRGNVIGVTTAALVGKERLNQALNFAIPAESFWDP